MKIEEIKAVLDKDGEEAALLFIYRTMDNATEQFDVASDLSSLPDVIIVGLLVTTKWHEEDRSTLVKNARTIFNKRHTPKTVRSLMSGLE